MKTMKIQLWQQILIALVLGIGVGLLVPLFDFPEISNILKSLGDFFFRLIKMLIVPLVFISLVVGMTGMGDTKKMGRIAGKTIVLYLSTTAVAIVIGLLLASAVNLGSGVDISGAAIPEKVQMAADTNVTFTQTILNLVPTSVINAMAKNNILQVIVFAILFGFAITKVGEKAEPVKKLCDSIADTIYSLTATVMKFAPIGVFGVMAWAVAVFGPQIVGSLFLVVLISLAASLIHLIITYSSLLGFAKLNPLIFYKKVISPAVFAFVSTSSSGTLPVSLTTSREKMGVSDDVASFVLPLGATINMDGTALYQGVSAIFIANAFNIDLTATHYLMIILMATLASIGTAGTPGAGLIMLSGLLIAVGLPLEGIGLIFAIDRVLDMIRTSLNVIGDNAIAVFVSQSENDLNREVYNNKRL